LLLQKPLFLFGSQLTYRLDALSLLRELAWYTSAVNLKAGVDE
jgi:hypothetical protein